MRNGKRIIALFLSLLMMLSIAACGESETPAKIPTKAPTQATEPAETTAPPTEAEGELIEASLFSFRYDPELWVIDEEPEDDWAFVSMQIPNPEDPEDYLVWLDISAIEDDHHSFRSNLRYYGFDAYDYAVNDAYETVEIGGVNFLASIDEDGAFYFMRLESAGIDVEIEIYGDSEHEAVASVLDSLVFTIDDGDNVDAPWPWDGEPYAVDPGSTVVGTFTLNSEQIPFTEYVIADEIFAQNIASVGDSVYIINDCVAAEYRFDGETLTFVSELDLDDEYEFVDAASDGTVWFSSFMRPLINWDGEKTIASYDDTDTVSMHPDGTWGINWFYDSTVQKLTFADGIMTSQDFTLGELDSVSQICVDAMGNVFACGRSLEDDYHRVYVYDENLELQTVLQESDGTGLGSVTFATATDNGFLLLDGNMREVLLYTADGTMIGKCDFDDLFGTYYPWPCDACVTDDGSILVIMTDERMDESAEEVIVFKLTGF